MVLASISNINKYFREFIEIYDTFVVISHHGQILNKYQLIYEKILNKIEFVITKEMGDLDLSFECEVPGFLSISLNFEKLNYEVELDNKYFEEYLALTRYNSKLSITISYFMDNCIYRSECNSLRQSTEQIQNKNNYFLNIPLRSENNIQHNQISQFDDKNFSQLTDLSYQNQQPIISNKYNNDFNSNNCSTKNQVQLNQERQKYNNEFQNQIQNEKISPIIQNINEEEKLQDEQPNVEDFLEKKNQNEIYQQQNSENQYKLQDYNSINNYIGTQIVEKENYLGILESFTKDIKNQTQDKNYYRNSNDDSSHNNSINKIQNQKNQKNPQESLKFHYEPILNFQKSRKDPINGNQLLYEDSLNQKNIPQQQERYSNSGLTKNQKDNYQVCDDENFNELPLKAVDKKYKNILNINQRKSLQNQQINQNYKRNNSFQLINQRQKSDLNINKDKKNKSPSFSKSPKISQNKSSKVQQINSVNQFYNKQIDRNKQNNVFIKPNNFQNKSLTPNKKNTNQENKGLNIIQNSQFKPPNNKKYDNYTVNDNSYHQQNQNKQALSINTVQKFNDLQVQNKQLQFELSIIRQLYKTIFEGQLEISAINYAKNLIKTKVGILNLMTIQQILHQIDTQFNKNDFVSFYDEKEQQEQF